MKRDEKNRALLLRKNGESINAIAQKIGVAKSSVSLWVKDVQLSKKKLQTLRRKGFSSEVIEKRRMKRIANEQIKRETIMLEAGKHISSVTINDLRIIGLCLYWGEGGKTNQGSARISNSDPAVIMTMMRFFREVCLVEEKKFRGLIHIHSHLNKERAEKYWSKVSSIPRQQFYKTYIKPSIASKGKKDNLPYGTFDIYVCNTKLFLQIIGQIEKMKDVLGVQK